MYKKNFFLTLLLCSLTFLVTACTAFTQKNAPAAPATAPAASSTTKAYQRLVVVSDAHYPTKLRAENDPKAREERRQLKLQTAKEIDSWTDVDLVAFTGDTVELTGSPENYALAKEFVDQFHQPKAVIAGNHEFMYEDQLTAQGKLKRASQEEREAKLKRFQTTFGLSSLYYTKELGSYLLIFLSPEVASGKYLTELSPDQLTWLGKTLQQHKEQPTLIFFHAPLAGTLKNYSASVNKPNFVAQPEKALEKILLANPQIVLWVSGHTHTPATNESFANSINYYQGKILNVHNPSLDNKTNWTNSFYLYPDKIVIKTYNHNSHSFMDQLERTVELKGHTISWVPKVKSDLLALVAAPNEQQDLAA